MIPKQIFQIWVGDGKMPEREAAWCAQMQKMNSASWKYKLYGNELLTRFASDPYVRHLQDIGTPLAFLVDRLRILLLHEEGGLYADTDCQPIQPLDKLPFWNWDHVKFVYGSRSPSRPDVSLWRGVSLLDNTVLASAPQSRMSAYLLDAWKPNNPRITGHGVGVRIIDSWDWECVPLHYKYFYDMKIGPETIFLHDPHNAGTWVKDARKPIPVGDTHVIAAAK